jgi:NAD-dependent DNA ligase
MCNNEKCSGRVGKQLSTNAKMIQLKGVGPKTLDWFSTDFDDLIDLIVWVRKFGNTQDIENYGIKFNSKSHQNFLSIFNNIKTLTVPQVIVMLGYNNVGLKLAEQVSKLYAGQVPDWTSQDKSLVQLFYKDDVKQLLNEKVTKLESVGVTIEQPIEKVISNDAIFVCLTGSPKEYGYATKEDFLKNFNNVVDTKITDKQCNYLITDDMNSTSSKMKTAEKKGITIMTYSDFYNKMK